LFRIPKTDPGRRNGTSMITLKRPLPPITASGTFIQGRTPPKPGKKKKRNSLSLNGFDGTGIEISGPAARWNRVEDCYLGSNQNGIVIDAGARDNTIGGRSSSSSNVFLSGKHGVLIKPNP